MSNKRRVFVSLHHRYSLSIRENRQRLRHAAYHWAILICPKKPKGSDSHSFDVSDGIILHPTQKVDLNPEGNWFFRAEANAQPDDSPHLLGRVMIGKLPNEVSYENLHSLLEQIPLPEKDAEPVQNCVSWTRAAIRKLQENGFAEQFDLDPFMDKALAFADQRLHETTATSTSINYTTRRM